MKNQDPESNGTEQDDVTKEGKQPTLDSDLALISTAPTVWGQPPVEVQPSKQLSSWSVYRAIPKDGKCSGLFDLHFVGRDLTDGGGCVSSKIMSFDPKTMTGTTSSGRKYKLVSFPGHNSDAEYVLNHWVEFNDVDVDEVTEEFMKAHGLTRDEIANRERSRWH